MSVNIKSESWLNITGIYTKINGVFSRVLYGYVKVSGVWKLIYQYIIDNTIGFNIYQTYNILLSGTDTLLSQFAIYQQYIILESAIDTLLSQFAIYQTYLIQEDV